MALVLGASCASCHSDNRETARAIDSARIVTRVLATFSDSMPEGARALGLTYRFVRYAPDSAGACVWIEEVLPDSVRHTDGGSFPVAVDRNGQPRVAAIKADSCASRPRLP